MMLKRCLLLLLLLLFCFSLEGQTAVVAQSGIAESGLATVATDNEAFNQAPAFAPTYFARRGDALQRFGNQFARLVQTFATVGGRLSLVVPEENEPVTVQKITAVSPPPPLPPSPTPTIVPLPTATPPPSQSYIVRSGDSFYSIANQFGITIDALAFYNALPLRSGLVAGMTLQIPPRSFAPPALNEPRDGERFIWPVNSRSIVQYARYGHMAIDIALPVGTPIQAAADGVVEYAGWHDGGYGNVVVVLHPDGWRSVYAHNSSLNVVSGQPVMQGEVVAESGNTGRSSMPHLHLEFSHHKVTQDPCNVLPIGC